VCDGASNISDAQDVIQKATGAAKEEREADAVEYAALPHEAG